MTTATLLEAERGLTRANENAIQAYLEERARIESSTGAPMFRDWCADHLDTSDWFDVLIGAIDASNDSLANAEHHANAIAARYVQWRCDHASSDERADIAQELREEKEG